jgi:hypothetical protein
MRKKRRQPKGPAKVKPKRTARATIAAIKREMQEPLLAKSVRNDTRYQIMLAAEEPNRSCRVPMNRVASNFRPWPHRLA